MPVPQVAGAAPQNAGPRRPHSPWVVALLTLMAAAFFSVFVALGVWQLERRTWKLDLIERVAQRLNATPAPVPPPAQWARFDAAAHTYQPVHLEGHWLPGKLALVQATTALGAGYWVLVPLQQANGTQVLVNRGFVPQAQRSHWLKISVSDSAAHEPLVALNGLLRASEPGGGFLRRNDPGAQRWHSRDVRALALALALPHAAPFFVDAGLPDPPNSRALDPRQSIIGPWPRPGLTVVHFANNHLVYAVTWFGLALMIAWAVWVVARYERRLRISHAPPPH